MSMYLYGYSDNTLVKLRALALVNKALTYGFTLDSIVQYLLRLWQRIHYMTDLL